MRTRRTSWSRTVTRALLASVLLLLAPLPCPADQEPAPGESAAAEEPPPREDCCFTNVSYTGVCRVKPEENETCASILKYLNDPMSKGKAYCGSTTIRGGWQEVVCEAPKSGGPVESR
jgi:hypothetical protein